MSVPDYAAIEEFAIDHQTLHGRNSDAWHSIGGNLEHQFFIIVASIRAWHRKRADGRHDRNRQASDTTRFAHRNTGASYLLRVPAALSGAGS